MNNYRKTLTIGLICSVLVACGGEKTSNSSSKVYEVKQQPVHETLHFTGIIKPLKESALTGPMDAVVESMSVHYGQMVKKGDVVFTLNSNALQREYNDTLTDYLKAKDSYSIAKAKFAGTQDLWDSGLIPKNNYLSEKSSVDTARVTLMQSMRKMTELLDKMEDISTQNVSQLSLADFAKVRKILTSSHNMIHIKAPVDGVLLYPPKVTQDKMTRISVGSVVKSGQVLGLVGDLKGISIEIDVPEVDIDKIHAGMETIVTGVAFGPHRLKGTLVAVNAQASSNGNGGSPSFTALVVVDKLTSEQQPWIKVGMSAALEINADSNNHLLIPIAALTREKGSSIVRVKLPNGSIESRKITTGQAQADSVIVATGLKAGDMVVYD